MTALGIEICSAFAIVLFLTQLSYLTMAKGFLALLNHGMKIDKLEIPKMF
ncbi:hypothetical protein QUB30_01025 [Microcoleus sp. BROC3]